MSNVVPLHRPDDIDTLWKRYQRLIRAQIENPALAADRHHVDAMLLAHRAYAEAFGRLCDRA